MRFPIPSFLLAALLAWSAPAQAEPSYDINQQVFTLSYLSNAVSGLKGDAAQLEPIFVKRANKFLADDRIRGLIGDWSIAWGPVVFEFSDDSTNLVEKAFCNDPTRLAEMAFCDAIKKAKERATNAAFIARRKGAGGDTYVLGIAATNFISLFDWLVEDAGVELTKKWTFGQVPRGLKPKISFGTATGLKILMGLKDPATGQTIERFLNKAAGKNNTLYIAGHSLAGALSPTLALAYFNEDAALDKSEWKSVEVYPSAGATPGNGDFSKLFNKIFPVTQSGSQPYSLWNADIWNSLDVVPHAWNEGGLILFHKPGTLAEVPVLYGDDLDIFAKVTVLNLVETARLLALGHDYTSIPPREPQPVAGRLAGELKGKVVTFQDFLDQMVYQHVDAYAQLIGIEKAYDILRHIQKCDVDQPPPDCK